MSEFLTCRNDADPKRTGKQSFIRTVWIDAAVHLRPPDEPMDDLTEHPISSDTNHPETGTTSDVRRSLKSLKRCTWFLILSFTKNKNPFYVTLSYSKASDVFSVMLLFWRFTFL